MNQWFMFHDEKYQRMKNEGIITKDIDRGVRRYIRHLGEETSYEQLKENCSKVNLNSLLLKVCSQFEKRQGIHVPTVELINRYKEGIAVFAHPSWFFPAVFVDELYESTIFDFLLLSLFWSEFYDDQEVREYCFSNMLSVFHQQCIFGKCTNKDDVGVFLEWVANKDVRLLDWAADCYWSIMAFSLAHEMYHICYNKKVMKDAPDKWYRGEEFKADRVAYDIVLHMIMEDAGKSSEEKMLYEHSCMAPMMLMDFFDLHYYTDRVLYKQWIDDKKHPLPRRRKEQLFGILYQPEYMLNTEDGYILYQAFLDVTHKDYKDNLLLKMSRGKLNGILRYDAREELLRKNVEEEEKDNGSRS